MSEEQNTQNVENQETETQNVDNTTEQQTETQEQEKTFTQAELDKLISERLKRERSKQPDKTELEQFKEWKKSQQTEQERLVEERKEFEATKNELQRLRNEKEVLKSGINNQFSDYVTYEVGKMEGDFSENLTVFLKNNPQFSTNNSQNTPSQNVQAGGQKVKNETGKIDTTNLSDAEYYRLKKQNKI